MGEVATAPSDHERYAKDGFHRTTTEMVDRITSVVFTWRRINRCIPRTGLCPWGAGFCGIGFCWHNMPPRRAAHCRIRRRRKRFKSRDLTLSQSAFGSLWILASSPKNIAAFQLAAYCCDAPWIALHPHQKLATVRQQVSSRMLQIGAMKFRLALAIIFLFSFSIARADEAIFAWTYTTDLLPKGRWEFEQWVTSRWEKEHGTYSVLDFREELESALRMIFRSRSTSTTITSMRTITSGGRSCAPQKTPARCLRNGRRRRSRRTIPRRRSTVIILNRYRSRRFTAC